MLINHPKQIYVVVGVLLLLTQSVPARDNIESTALAIVDGDTIFARAFSRELGRIHSGEHDTSRTSFDVEKLLERLINERLMVQDAVAMGLNQEPGYKARIEKFKLNAAVELLLRENLPDSIPITEGEISETFAKQFRKFHIYLVILNQKSQADSSLRALKAGAKLEDIAAQYAGDQYRLGGGDKGLRYWLELNEFLRPQVDSARVGELRGPFPYRDGFAIFRLLASQPADTSELGIFRGRILTTLQRQLLDTVHEEFIASLKSKFGVVVNDSLLNLAAVITDTSAYSASDSGWVLASVGDSTITLTQLRHKILHSAVSRSPEMLNPMKFSVLKEMINHRLFQREVISRGYITDNERVKWKTEAYSDSLLVMDYLSKTVTPQVVITPVMEDTFFQAHRDYYHSSGEVKISQLTVADQDSADRVLARLNAGADFTWMVRSCSTDRYAGKSGDRGWLKLVEFPESLRKVLDTLSIGVVTGPYQNLDGYMLIKLTDRKPGEPLPLSQVRGAVQESLKQMEFDRILKDVLEQLNTGSKITINHEALKALQFSAIRGK
jgi:parvulin-like peptidyl-prolyl isomerase